MRTIIVLTQVIQFIENGSGCGCGRGGGPNVIEENHLRS